MSRGGLDAEFVTSRKGRVLVTFRQPALPAKSCVLLVPPLAEEMNKSRRMFATLGQLLLQQDIATVLPDLHGTGDSDGEFADADWHTWCADLEATVSWAERTIGPVTKLVAVRLGAALAADAAERGLFPNVDRVVLWQPIFDTRRHLTQFLRMRTATALMQESRRESVDELKQRLRDGATLEVAGYGLSGALALGLMEAPTRQALPAIWRETCWIELQRNPAAPMSSSSQGIVDVSRERGSNIETRLVAGEPFWATTEDTVNLPMIHASIEVLGT